MRAHFPERERLPYRSEKEHVGTFVHALEAFGVVGKPVARVRSRRVAQQDALHLSRKIGDHGRVIPHHVGVAGIGHEDELPVRIGLEDLVEEKLADAERGADVGEVQGAIVKGAARVGFVYEVHVVARDLLRGGGQVVEMHVGDAAGPVRVDAGHVRPLHEGFGEGIQQAELGFVDLGDSEDVVNVGDDGQACGGNEVGCCVAVDVAFGVDVQALQLVCGIASRKATVVDLHEAIEIAFARGGYRVFDLLAASRRRNCSASALFARSTGCRRGFEVECDVLIGLLDDVDFGSKVSSLRSLRGWECLNGGAN